MTQDFRETKIKILSEEHSRAFQEAVIAAGGRWGGERGRYLHAKFLFVAKDLRLTYCDPLDYFKGHEYKEIQFPIPVATKNLRKDFDPAMKQIIVNVGDLTIEEKQRVSEALAKIQNIRMNNPMYWDSFVTLYGPSSNGVTVGFGYIKSASATHTPQQVLAMAGMAPSVDTLIIADSAGNIIYDSTLDALNRLIKQRANPGKGGALPDSGVSVKLDKNGMAVMVEKRKVRKDFDPGKEYRVDVLKCTEEEKRAVQQAFFDVGFIWKYNVRKFSHFDAAQYTNTTGTGKITAYCMYGSTTEDCNMTAKEFLELVYEPDQVGHPHAELMARYAEDAKTHSEPWKLWQTKTGEFDWIDCQFSPMWDPSLEYRRKPKTHTVHGVEIPDLRVSPEYGDGYYLASTSAFELTTRHTFVGDNTDKLWVKRGITYQNTDEGRQAAILHSKTMLGINT